MIVFVYGTLTEPGRVADLLDGKIVGVPGTAASRAAGERFRGRATVEGVHRVEGQYPTLAPGGSVGGRLLRVDGSDLERLDEYEGVDRGLYVRVEVPRANGDGRVQTYVGDPTRVGTSDVHWPGDGTFDERVRDYISRADVVVRRDE